MKFLRRQKIRQLNLAGKVMQEILNHDVMHHPHITDLYLTLSCPTHIIMLMEYVDGGELFAYIISEGKVKLIILLYCKCNYKLLKIQYVIINFQEYNCCNKPRLLFGQDLDRD